jgi:hypothetical protein
VRERGLPLDTRAGCIVNSSALRERRILRLWAGTEMSARQIAIKIGVGPKKGVVLGAVRRARLRGDELAVTRPRKGGLTPGRMPVYQLTDEDRAKAIQARAARRILDDS